MIGFVYIWRDRKHPMYYVGSHMGRETDGYIGGSRWFVTAYRRRPNDFRRRIVERIYQGTVVDVRAAEQRWLDMIKPDELGVRYYDLKLIAAGIDSATAKRVHAIKGPDGKSVHAVKAGSAPRGIPRPRKDPHALKDENGKSVLMMNLVRQVHAKKNDAGKSVHAVKAGKIGGRSSNAKKDELGRSVNATKGGTYWSLLSYWRRARGPLVVYREAII